MTTLRSGMLAAAVTALLLQGACDGIGQMAGPPEEANFNDGLANTSRTLDLHAPLQPGEFLLIYELKNVRGQFAGERKPGPGIPDCLTNATLTIPKRQATAIIPDDPDAMYPWMEVEWDLGQRAAENSIGPATFTIPQGEYRILRTEEVWDFYIVDVWIYYKTKDGVTEAEKINTLEIRNLKGWVDVSIPCTPPPPNPHSQGAGG